MVFLGPLSRSICRSCSVLQAKSAELRAVNRLLCKKSENEIHRKNYSAYEGDGKTVGFVLNKKSANNLLIGSVKTDGFIMASGAELVGSVIMFPHSIICWHVTTIADVTEDSLTLFKVLEPKLDILVLGYGIRQDYTTEVRLRFTQICKNLGIRFEALPTVQAVGLYNFLAEERRFVAGALIPPTHIDKFNFDRSKDLQIESDLDDPQTLLGAEGEKKLLK